jgi:hypothetical protein
VILLQGCEDPHIPTTARPSSIGATKPPKPLSCRLAAPMNNLGNNYHQYCSSSSFPHFLRYPFTLPPLFLVWFCAHLLQRLKGKGESGVWLRCELQWEALSSLAVCCQFPSSPSMIGRDDCPMVRIVDNGRSKCNLSKIPKFVLPYQNIIRLSVVPSPHPLLIPGPSRLGCLHFALSKGEFPRCVDEVYFVDEVSSR